MIVKIDKREASRLCPAVQYYKKNHTIIIEKLPIGDFIFTDNKTEVVFEFKTLNDFRNSVKNGRMFDQALRQFRNFDHHFIIIVYEKNVNPHELFNDEKYREAFASLNSFTTVITCPTTRLALKMMETQAKLCFEANPLEKRPFKKVNNVAYNYLLLIKGIDKVKAHNICKHLNLRTFDDLRGVTTKRLTKVPGIGFLTAQRITTSIKLN